MTMEEIEARIRALEDKNQVLERKNQALEKKVQTLEDIEAIKKLQRAYGYYIEHWMVEDLNDLFADGEDVSLLVAAGEYRGKEAIKRFGHHGKENVVMEKAENREFLHQVMQLCGVVHVDPDGKTAHGRWYGFGAHRLLAEGGGTMPGWMNGVYENDYVKQDGIWKLKKVHWCMTFHSPWSDPTKRVMPRLDRPYERSEAMRPSGPPEETQWPSGYICPFHFKNPVSGRKTIVSENVV
jgi:hypothetical protein